VLNDIQFPCPEQTWDELKEIPPHVTISLMLLVSCIKFEQSCPEKPEKHEQLFADIHKPFPLHTPFRVLWYPKQTGT
jgi:hypothetical protein